MGFNADGVATFDIVSANTGCTTEIRDDFLLSIEDRGYNGCDGTQMEIPVSRPNLTIAVPSPERQNLMFESGIMDSEPRS